VASDAITIEASKASTTARDAIVVREVEKTYLSSNLRQVKALEAVSFSVQEGELVTIIGPSGCGKSTLLHNAGGLLQASGGAVEIYGEPIVAPRPRLASFVFQDANLFPWRTIRGNIELALKFADLFKGERREHADAALRAVGMSRVADSYPGELSGGMRQRVAVARALAMNTPVLLMDEPFAALDEQRRMKMGEDITRILEGASRTVVMVTHSLAEAIYLADRIVVMSTRPGMIKEIIEVGEKRPRQPSFMLTDRFSELRNRLFRLLETTDDDAD
jgi:NitT/TauT family transport system ATP-binding protein